MAFLHERECLDGGPLSPTASARGSRFQLSFPNSVWERRSAKLRFASSRGTRSGASPPGVPKQSLGTRVAFSDFGFRVYLHRVVVVLFETPPAAFVLGLNR